MTGYAFGGPPAHHRFEGMFSRDGRWAVCTVCGAHLPAGEVDSVAGDLHWSYHNEVEDRLRKLEAKWRGL